MPRGRTRVTGAPGAPISKNSKGARSRPIWLRGRGVSRVCYNLSVSPARVIAIKSHAQDPIWLHRGVLLPRALASACDMRAWRLINLSHTRAIDTNIGWTVRLDRRRDIAPPLKLPSAVFFFLFLFYFSSRAVWFSGISDEPKWANCACDIACFQSRTGSALARTEESTHLERSARNALSAMLRRVILPIWPFLSRGRKSPRVQLVCETTGPAHESPRNVPEERDLRAD